MTSLQDYVVFNDKRLEQRYANARIPIDTLFEAYFDGTLDIPGDIYDLMRDRHAVAKHVFTPAHLRFFLSRFLPESLVHSKSVDQRLVRDHYDRGDDFFAAFLGPRMVYTSGYFTDPGQTVEEAQDQKMELVCRKLMIQAGDTFLDIGCGWGTLTKFASERYGAHATGVTLSVNQAEYGNRAIADAGLADRARILCRDYRDIAAGKYRRIASLEMVEHVGVKNLRKFYRQVYELLEDQGTFCLQWTGLRRGASVEDLVWGLFMSKYIFPGADASLPAAPMINAMERSGFEIRSVENVSPHYRLTIRKWHANWMRNREAVIAVYGERWYRIWHFFLAWSVTIAGQGTAACLQVIANKNINSFERSVWIGHGALGAASAAAR
jgi:sphingolipid C9-methyltransferase